jgi:protein-disulfide isomerase
MTQARIARAKLVVPVSEDRDHIRGPKTAPVTLVEYGDYECPFCGQAYYVLKELTQRAGNSMRFVFRNFPLTTLHPHAERAAEAAEAAGDQGEFWEMHEARYQIRIREDFLTGARSGVNGTPTFFINGFRYDGSWELTPLLAAIENAAMDKK